MNGSKIEQKLKSSMLPKLLDVQWKKEYTHRKINIKKSKKLYFCDINILVERACLTVEKPLKDNNLGRKTQLILDNAPLQLPVDELTDRDIKAEILLLNVTLFVRGWIKASLK